MIIMETLNPTAAQIFNAVICAIPVVILIMIARGLTRMKK